MPDLGQALFAPVDQVVGPVLEMLVDLREGLEDGGGGCDYCRRARVALAERAQPGT